MTSPPPKQSQLDIFHKGSMAIKKINSSAIEGIMAVETSPSEKKFKNSYFDGTVIKERTLFAASLNVLPKDTSSSKISKLPQK